MQLLSVNTSSTTKFQITRIWGTSNYSLQTYWTFLCVNIFTQHTSLYVALIYFRGRHKALYSPLAASETPTLQFFFQTVFKQKKQCSDLTFLRAPLKRSGRWKRKRVPTVPLRLPVFSFYFLLSSDKVSGENTGTRITSKTSVLFKFVTSANYTAYKNET